MSDQFSGHGGPGGTPPRPGVFSIMGSGGSGWLLMAPGILFILFGVMIIIWPEILAWLFAAFCIFVGFTLLALGNFMRRVSRQGDVIPPDRRPNRPF